MPDVQLPLSSYPGARVGEEDGRLVNAYAEKVGDNYIWRRDPGIASLSTTAGSGPRGMIEVGLYRYVAYSGVVIRTALDGSGATTLTGALTGTDPVTFARNNKVTMGVSTPDIVVVRSSGGAYVISGTTVSAYPDADLPNTVNSVTFNGGYFNFSIPDGRSFASELNSTDINALSFATAESSPDGLVRDISHANRLYMMGTASIEIWANQGFQPYPYGRDATVIAVGLKTAAAVAGMEPEFGRSPVFVAADDTVRVLAGFAAQIISTPPVERFIKASTPSTLQALVYTFRGNACWAVSSDIGTWVYDFVTQRWHERKSNGDAYWRASYSLKSGEQWVVADRDSGNIGIVQEGVRTEYGDPLADLIDTVPFREFPFRWSIPAAFFHYTESSDCSVNISASLDGGKTWLDFGPHSMADVEYEPIRVNCIGESSHHGVRFRLQTSDDADWSLMGASVPDPLKKAA